MTVTEIRLRILELSRPHGISLPDVEMWIKRARQIEEYVTDAADTPTEAPQKRRGRPPKNREDNPALPVPNGSLVTE
jgi:hypothetical protein